MKEHTGRAGLEMDQLYAAAREFDELRSEITVVEGLQSSLTHAEEKLAQLNAQIARKQEAIDLGIPTFREIVARTTAVAAPQVDARDSADH
ncbi:hypothetical protein [Streptomyces sp. 2314.4]|uniref:hypothetical protein n=1 Tax=Streptomyces sp. 2314.4 TaxID=1881025 RepID=UPI0008950F3C|nr:hypothetical protein [Streptomyces sp. 2314.4]SEC12496.1 hypothetical protein SAMN05428943_1079 [Streptomyces sp. 2314.4]